MVYPAFLLVKSPLLVLKTTGGPIGGARPAAGDGAAEALRRGQGGADFGDGWAVFVRSFYPKKVVEMGV